MPTLRIDLAAIVRNHRRIAALAPSSVTAAVVKADAYGLGAGPVSTALAAAGCRDFFVAHWGEVAAVRERVPHDATIYVLNGLGADPAACLATGAIPVLNAPHHIAAWRALAAKIGRELPAILQLDTGMARLGLAPADFVDLIERPEALDGIALRYVMSHLACADEPDAPANREQRDRFVALAARLPGTPRSFANSGAAFLGPDFHFDLLRPGIALYGGAPRPDVAMEPVVTLTAPIIQSRRVAAGRGIGYGLTASAPHDRIIATIGVGYADGWPRRLGGHGAAFIAGERVPIVGRVSMDSMLLDVTDLPEEACAPGTAVELIGPHQSVDEVAAAAQTISYEILTQLGARYARHYIGLDAPVDPETAT